MESYATMGAMERARTRLKRELEAGWGRTIPSSAGSYDTAVGSFAGATYEPTGGPHLKCFRTTVPEVDLHVLGSGTRNKTAARQVLK